MMHPNRCGGLGALIHALALKAGARPSVEAIHSTPWASITFSGARHRLALRFDGDAANDFADALAVGLDYAEFELGSHILVNIDIVDRDVGENFARLIIEALIIEAD